VKASLPAKVLNFLAQIQLGWANEVQEIHRRNGKAVDKEVRDVLVKRMREGVELTRDQEELLKEINKVVGGEKGWKEFNSSYPGVEMQLKVRLSNRGEERKASFLVRLRRLRTARRRRHAPDSSSTALTSGKHTLWKPETSQGWKSEEGAKNSTKRLSPRSKSFPYLSQIENSSVVGSGQTTKTAACQLQWLQTKLPLITVETSDEC